MEPIPDDEQPTLEVRTRFGRRKRLGRHSTAYARQRRLIEERRLERAIAEREAPRTEESPTLLLCGPLPIPRVA